MIKIGQWFVEIKDKSVYLRRPVSVCNIKLGEIEEKPGKLWAKLPIDEVLAIANIINCREKDAANKETLCQ